MKFIIASIVIPIVALVSFGCIASETQGMVSESDLMGFFESVERQGTNFLFTTHGGGGRFIYSINGINEMDEKVSAYGETITVPCNSVLTVYNRTRTMIFSPLSEENGHKGYHLSLKIDRRSRPGGILTTNYAYMVYLDEKLDSSGGEKGIAAPEGNRAMPKSAGTPEKGAERKCLKGLTLLPCEEKEQ